MFDLRKVKKSEDGKPFEFTVDGEMFSLPPFDVMDYHVTDNIAEGKFVAAMQALLGPADFRRFDKLKISMGELNALFEEYAEANGTTVGESAASTGS